MNKTLTQRTHKKKVIRWMRILFIASAIIVPLTHFSITYVYVNFRSFFMAFYKTVDGEMIWTFDNFTMFFKVLEDPNKFDLGVAFINSFKTWLISTILFPIGIIINYFLYKKIIGTNIWRMCSFLPGLICGVVTVAFYKGMVAPEGPIALIVQKLYGLSDPPDILGDPRFANFGIWLHMIWLGLFGDVVIWSGTLSRIPDSLIESGQLEGIKWLQEIWYLILPCVWPVFLLKLIIHCGGMFSASGAVFLLTGGLYDTNTFSNWMYLQVYNVTDPNSNALNYMSAVGLMVTAVSLIIMFFTSRLKKLVGEVEY